MVWKSDVTVEKMKHEMSDRISVNDFVNCLVKLSAQAAKNSEMRGLWGGGLNKLCVKEMSRTKLNMHY